jgi:2-isopropylmalate synthase
LQYIQNHYQTVSLDSLCTKFHYNKSYLSRLIHKNTGRSFIDIVTDLKLSQAIDLLTNTTLSISDISELVGYHNVDHFSKHFKKKYSCPPSVYRNSL